MAWDEVMTWVVLPLAGSMMVGIVGGLVLWFWHYPVGA
jgi:hypothetical protein